VRASRDHRSFLVEVEVQYMYTFVIVSTAAGNSRNHSIPLVPASLSRFLIGLFASFLIHSRHLAQQISLSLDKR
jgi:hypothetical protein